MASKKAWTAVATIALLSAAAGPALAYIIPADVILSRMAAHRKGLGLSTLSVQGIRTRNLKASPMWGGLKAGRAWRVQTRSDNGTAVNLLVKDRQWNFQLGGAPGTPSRISDDLILTFLFPAKTDSGGKRGLAFLKRHKVKTRQLSLGRINGRIAYVIGAKPGDLSVPQIWIDKLLQVPLRFIYIDKSTNIVHEQVFGGYGTEVVDQWFPRTMQRLENGKVVEDIVINQLTVNPSIDKDLLAPPS